MIKNKFFIKIGTIMLVILFLFIGINKGSEYSKNLYIEGTITSKYEVNNYFYLHVIVVENDKKQIKFNISADEYSDLKINDRVLVRYDLLRNVKSIIQRE